MKTLSTDHLIADFDEQRRILHVAYKKRIHPTTREHLDILFASFRSLLDKYIDSGRFYLIIDLTNFIVEPDLKSIFATLAREMCEKYIVPQGIARYGYQITRITIRAAYHEQMNENPNIFNSRDEAYCYIYTLIDRNRQAELALTSSTMSGNFENR